MPSREYKASSTPCRHIRLSISSATGRATQAWQFAHTTQSLFVTTSKALREVLGGPVAESPHRQCWIDPGTGWKNSSAEDVQSWRVVDAQIAVHHRRGRVFAHSASAEVVAAADATKALTTPRFHRTHHVKDLFGLLFHPVGKAPLVLSQIASDTHKGEPEPASVTVPRVQIEEVCVIGQRLGLETNSADVLPASKVILVLLTPGRNVGWQTLAAYLYRQLLVFDVGGSPPNEPMSRRVEVGGNKIVQAPHLRRRAGVLVEDYVREEAVDVGPHLGHEVLADLPRVVAQTVGMPPVTREQEEPHVLEGVAAKDHRARLLHAPLPV